jgi:tetratricopeptide (TPR) repeat protein
MKPALPLILAALALSPLPAAAQSADLDARVDRLAREWAHANFEVHDKSAQAQDASRIAAEAEGVAHQFPGRAEPLVWEAIALSTEAGAKGGLGGLSLAKQARTLLEQAEKINPNALGDGSVYTSLGSLYAQVPGFPIGFGDAKKARAYLQKALAANPNGMDPNFFYGDFLMRQHDYAGAQRALEKAIAAPARPGREVADRGRREQAQALLAEAKQKLHA